MKPLIYRHFRKVGAYGVQHLGVASVDVRKIFLLTHPSRGATLNAPACIHVPNISTHTPLTGCNTTTAKKSGIFGHFYSHTPHGVQRSNSSTITNMYDFYSHTPHGVQHIKQNLPRTVGKFLLTHPSRGATMGIYNGRYRHAHFYSHTPRVMSC